MYAFNGKYKNGTFLYRRILNDRPVIPDEYSAEVRHFVYSLMEKDPSQRLGAGNTGVLDVKNHPFFSVSYIPIYVIIKY
jgi:hypothetical protein